MSPFYNALATLLTLLTLLLLLPTTQALASPPDLTFLCDQIPDICTNMCWAVRCAQPRFPPTLTLDLDSLSNLSGGASIGRSYRNMTASCPTNMMCGLHGAAHPGHRDGITYRSCNVFPFPGTRESAAQKGHQVSRCVPEAQQREQNAQLSLLSRTLQLHLLAAKKDKKDKKNKGGEEILLRARINFGNPGEIPYCDNRPCQNDGFQVQDGAVTSRAAGGGVVLRYYKTSAGMTLASVGEIETPYTFSRPVGKGEVVPAGVDAWYDYGYAGQRVRMMGDVVVEKVDGSDS